jgi:hypothetical protein
MDPATVFSIASVVRGQLAAALGSFGRISDQFELDDVILLEAELKYIAGFHALVILVAIFGASVTFPLILTPLNDPPNPANAPTIRVLLAVSWALFVLGVIGACLSAGDSYTRGYVRTIKKARDDARDATEQAFITVDEGGNIENRLRLLQISRASSTSSMQRAVRILRSAEKKQRERTDELEKSRNEMLHALDQYMALEVTEWLQAARLAAELRKLASGNSRLAEALGKAEQMHTKAAEDAQRKTAEAVALARDIEVDIDRARKTADILGAAAADFERRLMGVKIPFIVRQIAVLFVLFAPRTTDRETGNLTIVFVIIPISGALICMCAVVFMYIRTVGIVALAFVGFLLLSFLGMAIRPSWEFYSLPGL